MAATPRRPLGPHLSPKGSACPNHCHLHDLHQFLTPSAWSHVEWTCLCLVSRAHVGSVTFVVCSYLARSQCCIIPHCHPLSQCWGPQEAPSSYDVKEKSFHSSPPGHDEQRQGLPWINRLSSQKTWTGPEVLSKVETEARTSF